MRKRLTFANITSLVALFLALTAGAYAAVSLPANSVGSRQLRAAAVTPGKIGTGAVTAGTIASGAVTAGAIASGAVSAGAIASGAVSAGAIAPMAINGSKVAPGSLTGADINLATLGKVPSAAAADSANVARVSTVTVAGTAPLNSIGAATATCGPGLTVVGGGASLADEDNELVNDSYPSGTNGWTVHVATTMSGGTTFTVYAICVPAASTS